MPESDRADFRSDTVTRPSPAMYEAMAKAPLGDDVLGDDPTVTELENYATQLFGKEAAVFLPSGTMANQIAVRVQTERDSEVLIEQGSHAFVWEQGGLAQISGVQARTLVGDKGCMPFDELSAAVRGDNEHWPRTALLCLENTHNGSGGSVLPLRYIEECRAFADQQGLRIHLDGARLVNAEAASGISLDKWVAPVDTVSCCLSKGLGAPIGSLLISDAATIVKARRARKLLGGGMRQAGVLAACGLVALRDQRDALVEDHRRARELAAGFEELDGVSVAPPETNMVYIDLPGRARAAQDALTREGVMAFALDDNSMRWVLHRDLNDRHIEFAVAALRRFVHKEVGE